MKDIHNIKDLEQLFSDCFYESYNSKLVKGGDEPIYLPPMQTDISIAPQPYAQIVFAHGYYASALHEIAHWCLAGAERRKRIDFGYWYSPDGRTAKQQQAFQKVECQPQAIEWAFCVASGFAFNVSCDNLAGDEFGRQPDHRAFALTVKAQVQTYLQQGFPQRAQQFIKALCDFYNQPEVKQIKQFN